MGDTVVRDPQSKASAGPPRADRVLVCSGGTAVWNDWAALAPGKGGGGNHSDRRCDPWLDFGKFFLSFLSFLCSYDPAETRATRVTLNKRRLRHTGDIRRAGVAGPFLLWLQPVGGCCLRAPKSLGLEGVWTPEPWGWLAGPWVSALVGPRAKGTGCPQAWPGRAPRTHSPLCLADRPAPQSCPRLSAPPRPCPFPRASALGPLATPRTAQP